MSEKKVCLFTGASGQLGHMFCRMFGAEYDIAAVYRNRIPDLPSQLQLAIDPLYPESRLADDRSSVYAIQADLTIESDLRRIVEVTMARFGRIDLLVNAAAFSYWAPMLKGDRLLTNTQQHFQTNVFVPLQLSTLVADACWKGREIENRRNNRNIINISSTAGLYIYTGQGQSIYSASKAALNYLTMHMAEEFGELGVRVNALAPNSFPSLIPVESAAEGIRRLAESEESGKILALDIDGERWM